VGLLRSLVAVPAFLVTDLFGVAIRYLVAGHGATTPRRFGFFLVRGLVLDDTRARRRQSRGRLVV
jgi:hypothetical protein